MMRLAFALFLFSLVLCSWAYWLLAWLLLRRFVRRIRAGGALNLEADDMPVSVLKALKGIDPGVHEDLLSFCLQDYPVFEVVFGVRDADDPAVDIVRRIQRDLPGQVIRLVVARGRGLNPKSALLHELVGAAQHQILAISDSDIRVEPDHLRRLVGTLMQPGTGLAHCLYRAGPASDLPSLLASMHVDQQFLPSVLVAAAIGQTRFALGASIAIRRADLEAVGGYAAIADHLADDYHLGKRVARLGLVVQLAPCIVSHATEETNLRSVWQHQVRWARTIFSQTPLRYPGLLLTFSTPLAALLLVFAALVLPAVWTLAAIAVLAISTLLRWAVASSIAADLQQPRTLRMLACVPLSDLLEAATWCAGMSGSTVRWRGITYRVGPDGRLCEPPARRVGTAGRQRTARPRGDHLEFLRRGIMRLDAALRRRDGIFEYTDDPECIFRAQLIHAPYEVVLHDGTRIGRGQPLLDLHFWNEHMPAMGHNGSGLAWARRTQQRVDRSLARLAEYFAGTKALRDIRAIRGRAVFLARDQKQVRRLARRLGFELRPVRAPQRLQERLHRFGEDLLVWGLVWAFNPRSARRGLRRPRNDFWMSRRDLVARYAAPRSSADRPLRDLWVPPEPSTSAVTP